MKGTTNSTELAVVSSGKRAGVWQRKLEGELARTGNLSESLKRAEALVVIIDKSFTNLMQRAVRNHDDCFEATRDALSIGKMLLPVCVENAVIPEANSLPKGIRAITQFQALALDRESNLPGVAARLVVATKTMSRPYVPAKTEGRRVFISYRREDSWYWASLLARALTQRLAAHNVFFDIGSIAPGRSFDTEIQSRIHNATDFIILIGPAFLAHDQKGRCRLDDPGDFVRREIITAIEYNKQIHIVLAGDASLPSQKQLPHSIAHALKDAMPQHLTDYREADSVASAILSKPLILDSLQSNKQSTFVPKFKLKPLLPPRKVDSARFHTPEQKAERLIMAAVPPLAALGWQPVDLAKSRGALMMIRSDLETYRFVFDFENFELILQERARGMSSLGLKRWIKRAICPVTPDAPDVDVLRLPDQQVEAMANPEAYLDRVGRSDLDMGSKPPMRSAQLDHYLRAFSQPGRRALDQQAHEHSRISARGGLRILKCVHRISLGENVIARAVATNSATGQVAAASGHGAYSIDILRGVAEHIGRRSNLNHLSFSKSGMLAVTNDKHQLSVFDCNGAEIVKRRTPYSAWKRVTGTRGDFETPSWSADEKRIAIGASDRIWIYNLDDDKFEQVALHQDGQINSASALFIPESDDLLIMHMWKIWRVSWRTGKIGQQLDIWAGSDFFEAKPEVTSMKQAGFDPNCLALSPDGRFLAIGGNDAQLVLADAKTLQPAALRVWHAPLVEGRQNGKIEALAFSPDGCKLASVANDSRLIVGDARSGDPLADGILSRELASHGIPVEHDVCWSVAGAQIVVVNSEGSIEVWDNGPDLI